MFCSKCGKQIYKDNKFCNSCGNKIDNTYEESNPEINKKKKSVLKPILITIGIIFAVCLIIGIITIKLIFAGLEQGIDTIKDKIDAYEEKEQTRENIYDSIPKELEKRNLISNNLKYISSSYGWGMESVDKTNKYYFYIPSEQYDKYKHYWLEGVEESEYMNGYNSKLFETGDYVFYAINVSDLKYTHDIEYGNVRLKANKQYYMVQIYDEAIFYNYIRKYEEDSSYDIFSNFQCKNDSISKEYFFSQNGNNWEIEELIR